MFKPLALALLFSLLLIDTATAQSEGRFALGGNISIKGGTTDTTHGHIDPGLLWRFGQGRNGWGWQYGLGWYGADIDQPIDGNVSEFGELHVRPFLGGYGYSHRFGRTMATAKLLAGYSFNSFDMLPAFGIKYATARDVIEVKTDVSNTFILRPEVSLWTDISEKIGLNISLGYIVSRPDVTISTAVGRDVRSINADMVMFKVGAVYSVF